VIAELAGELGRVHARRDALEKEIEEAFLAHPFGEILASPPGIGPRTGAMILAEIGDGTGFASGAKLAAYAGLAPVTRQSGTSLNAETTTAREPRETAQRRPHLPRPPTLRRHPRNAPRPQTLPARPLQGRRSRLTWRPDQHQRHPPAPERPAGTGMCWAAIG
jgi:transposase